MDMIPTEKQIKEIAELLECGMICFFHRPTGTIESHPDPDDPYFEPDQWNDVTDKIEEERENYDCFEKMDSTQGFRVMEDFVSSLEDPSIKERLLEVLGGKKPFSTFKAAIESSNYRQHWFLYKQEANIKWVRIQLNQDSR